MSVGLIALLDDVAAIAKVAVASLDDVAAQATKTGVKAAGVVIDDAAVTPRYVVGFTADRELPIVGKIAAGSLRNKLLVLLPLAMALSAFAPGLITPLLMIGGAFLSYEGAEKVFEAVILHKAHEVQRCGAGRQPEAADTRGSQRAASAIKTNVILSGRITVVTLAAILRQYLDENGRIAT